MVDHLRVDATPVQRADHVSRAIGREVWVKCDDLTHPRYGGNKVRKLALILDHARERGATDLVTVGAVGSHHVLATIVHGRAAGFEVRGVLVPQPRTDHVEEMARADLARGGVLVPARSTWQAPLVIAREMALLRARGRRPYFIALGGSNARGAAGYVLAVRELAVQIGRGEAPPWADAMVCALGSGGTMAGILAGARACGAPTEVVGVQVTPPWALSRASVAWLANRALRVADPAAAAARLRARDVRTISDQLGEGYGRETDAAREARDLFARDGIVLDPTYTAKAAAGLIALARVGPASKRYLFWHTLSSAPMGPLLEGAPDALPPAIRALMR